MYPAIAKWKESTFMEAHSKGYLETPFGYRTFYWNVLEPIPNQPGKFRKGKEAREALAFRPQSSGAAMLREAMLELEPHDGVAFNFLAPIHDAILVECPEESVGHVVQLMKKAMERPFAELGGLAIESEAKVGKRWSEMH
jgi:DNA polymerase I-like protein with 3'-5' exonuclease and polymerase domains